MRMTRVAGATLLCGLFFATGCDDEDASKPNNTNDAGDVAADGNANLDADAGDAAADGNANLDADDVAPDGNANVDADAGRDLPGDAARDVPDLPPTPMPQPCPQIDLTQGTTYYVCNCESGADSDCLVGDDGNSGTSPDMPFRSYERARTTFNDAMNAGDTVAFCRGGSFRTTTGVRTRWVNDRCTADNRCAITDYEPMWASGDEDRPTIASPEGGDTFSFVDGGNADHEEGVILQNLHLDGAGQGARGVFLYNDIDDVLMCNLLIENYEIGVHLAGSNDPDEGSDGRNDRIVLRNSFVNGCGDHGWLGSGHDTSIEYTVFENNGFERAVYNHNIYLSSPQGEARNMAVIGCDLYQSAIVDGQCSGTSLVVHGEKDGLLIEGNVVREDVGAAGAGCWGISVDTGYSSGEAFRNVVIRNNTVINVGNNAIGLNACENCLIENNIIIQEQPEGGRGITAPLRDRQMNDLLMTDITIRNNTIFYATDGSAQGIALGGEGTNHVSVSNVVYHGGNSNNFNCFAYDLEISAYAAIDHNMCFDMGGGGEWSNGSGDLAAWQSSTPFDANSQMGDPGFVSVVAPYDLGPDSGSPLRNAGHPTESSPADALGALREDGAPDIGAYEGL